MNTTASQAPQFRVTAGMLHYYLRGRYQCVAKDSEGFLIIESRRDISDTTPCLENISIKRSGRGHHETKSHYTEMTVTLKGSVFCRIPANGRANDVKLLREESQYHIRIVEVRVGAIRCTDPEYPHGIILRIRNPRLKALRGDRPESSSNIAIDGPQIQTGSG
jgi:hypothetical protein